MIKSRLPHAILSAYNRYIRGGRGLFRLGIYFFMFIIGFVYVFPFLYMIITSVKTPADLYDSTVNWVPRSLFLDNYAYALKHLRYPLHFAISVGLTVIGIVCHLFIDGFIGYGFARYNFVGKKFLFFMVILSVVVPVQVLILPQYLQFAAMKWNNSYLPLIVPLFFGFGLRSGLFIFLFRQFFIQMPKSLEEAAKIDGCSYIGTFFRIALPTASTAMLVCIVLSLVWHWNDYYGAAIYLNSAELWPLPSMLPRMYEMYASQISGTNIVGTNNAMIREVALLVTEGTVMAATFLVIAPVLAAYFFLQKKFMAGIERSGIVE